MMHRSQYRVAAAGLDARDARLIEIVFRHSQYNRHAFEVVPADPLDDVDILIVNTAEADGLRVFDELRALGRDTPIVVAAPSGASGSARYTISIERLTLQLLPILNRVVELEFEEPDTRPMTTDERARSAQVPGPAMAGPAMSRDAIGTAWEMARTDRVPPGRPLAGNPPELPPGCWPGHAAPPAGAASRSLPPGAGGAAQAPERLVADRRDRHERSGRSAPGALPETPWSASGSAGASVLPPPAQRVHVLVVDDSPTVRQQMTLAFERMGIVCHVADGALAGLERMAERHYDLVLVDIVMPEIDGYRLMREIRRRHRGVPVIILSVRGSALDHARGALAGCSDYLVKPVTLRRLEAAVIKALRRTLAIDDLAGLLRPISL